MTREDRRRIGSVSERYAEIMELPVPFAGTIKRGLLQGAIWGDAIALEFVKTAANGDAQAAREIRESLERESLKQSEDAVNEIKVSLIQIGGDPNPETSFKPTRRYDEVVQK